MLRTHTTTPLVHPVPPPTTTVTQTKSLKVTGLGDRDGYNRAAPGEVPYDQHIISLYIWSVNAMVTSQSWCSIARLPSSRLPLGHAPNMLPTIRKDTWSQTHALPIGHTGRL